MDTNQGSTEKQPEKPAEAGWQHTPSEAKPEAKKLDLKMPVNLPKFDLKLNLPEGGILGWIKNKLSEYKRVYSITKKPDKTEFTAIVKASGLGIIVIGMVGFIITMIVQVINMFK